MRFGRGIDAATADRFVGMYVNELTLRLRRRGPPGGRGAAPPRRGDRRLPRARPARLRFLDGARAARELRAVRGGAAARGRGVHLQLRVHLLPGAARPRWLRSARTAAVSWCAGRAGSPREPRGRPLGGAHAGRPLRRRARGRAARRPRGDRDRGGGRARRRRPGRDRGRLPRLREPGGRGQPQRRADGGAARRPARVGRRRDGEPPLRVGPLGGRRRVSRDRGRRRRPLRRRRRRVDEPRAARDGEAGARLPARRPHACTTRRSAGASRIRALEAHVPARVDGRDGRERRRALGGLARGPGRVRAPLAAALGRSGRTLRRRAACRSASSTRDEHPRPDTSAREAGGAEAGVPRRRHRHRRQLERAQRRRRRARDRVARRRRASSAPSRWRVRRAARSRASTRA